MRSLILSDVIGDDLRVIASGPTIAPIGTRQQAKEMLQDLGFFDELPQNVKDHLLLKGAENEPKTTIEECDAALMGSNSRCVCAMQEHCEGNAKMIDKLLEGLFDEAAAEIDQQIYTAKPGVPLLFGGEATVLLSGDGLVVGIRNWRSASLF